MLSQDSFPILRNARDGVTIAIPNWNHEYALPRSIRSALATAKSLTSKDIPAEVLVIDDDSRDGSLTLLRQLEALYSGDGLRVIALSENIGLPRVRNRALQKAQFRYIVFLDADNELIPDHIHEFYTAIQRTSATVVFGDLLARNHGSDETLYSVNNQPFKLDMFEHNYIDACALFDRQQVWDAGGFTTNEHWFAREDWELSLHLAANGHLIVYLPLDFGFYYLHAQSMIRQTETEDTDQFQALLAHLERVYDQYGIRKQRQLNTLHLQYDPERGVLYEQ